MRKLAAKIANGVILRCFLGVDQPKEEDEGVNYEELVVHVIEEATLIALDPVMALFGRAAWFLGLTKDIRHLKKSVAFMRKKSE